MMNLDRYPKDTEGKVAALCTAIIHKAGHSLLQLHKNGVDNNGRIINSTSPDPIIGATESEVKKFQSQVRIIDMIGETNQDKIIQSIKTV